VATRFGVAGCCSQIGDLLANVLTGDDDTNVLQCVWRAEPRRSEPELRRSMTMTAQSGYSPRRRKIVAGGLAALALSLSAAPDAAARVILQRGMSGGGLAQLDGSEDPRLAKFGLFASAMQLPEGTTLVLGAIQWIEAGTDLELRSIEVTQCIPVANRTDGDEVRGRMAVNGEGDYPFVIRAIDSGPPGSASDRIEIEVNTSAAREGAATAPSDEDFVYSAGGNLVAGDFQWLIADISLPE